VRSAIEAFRRRDVETMEALTSPEIEWDATRFADVVPDLAGVYHGIEGTRHFWRSWLTAWKDIAFDYELHPDHASGLEAAGLPSEGAE
jgi:hypothetical protein